MDDPQRLGRVLAAVSVALFCVNLDFFALNLALPRMAQDLDVAPIDLQWVVSAYMLSLGALLVLGGRLGDIFGRRRVLLAGLGLFGLSSLLCGAAPSAGVLIALRIVQGAGAALIFPVAISVLSNAFPVERRARAIGFAYGLSAVGTALGPFVGGALTELVSWRWVFWVNVPFAALAVLLTLDAVRESRDERAPRRVDLPGALALCAGLALLTFGFDQGEGWGWTSAATLGTVGGGVALLAGFVALELRVRVPLVDLRLFRNVPFDTITGAGLLSNVAYTVMIFASTLWLQQVEGLSPMEAGIVFLAPSTFAAAAGPLAGRLGEIGRPGLVMGGAMAVGGAALLVLSLVEAWGPYVVAFALCGGGFGLGWAFASVGTQQVIDPARAGEASGVVLTVLIAGGGLGVAGAATVIDALQRGGASLDSALDDVLRVVAVGVLVAASLLLAVSSRRRPQPAPAN